jgi:hypothetical protein
MVRIVSTWFYQQSRDEGGTYAQVRGDSSSEVFRDVYRRCVSLFFATARRANPDAELVLFLNRAWDPAASSVASDVHEALRHWGVRCEVLDYSFAPPTTWPPAWRNQFFVLDALVALSDMSSSDDDVVLLDSDIVWSGGAPSTALWEGIRAHGALTYRLDHGPDEVINGCSRRELTRLAADLGVPYDGILEYAGGEFVALTAETCSAIVELAGRFWPEILRLHVSGKIKQIEEGHLLSICYAALDVENGTGNRFVKRIWTQPFKYQNAQPGDLELALWHVPAEKKYGIRRLYRHSLEPNSTLWSCAEDEYRARVSSALGIPGNSRSKILRDVSYALATRAGARIRRGR